VNEFELRKGGNMSECELKGWENDCEKFEKNLKNFYLFFHAGSNTPKN
jgi:hypothetical protein